MNHIMRPVATMDVESWSLAGYDWDIEKRRWCAPKGAASGKIGLKVTGAFPYWEHSTARVLTLKYKIPGGQWQGWRPGMPPPADLCAWIASGGHIEFHNAMFEKLAWFYDLTPRHGWPPLPHDQVHCSMATAHVNGYPGALANLGPALHTDTRKDPEGEKLLRTFSMPRQPTKADPRVRIMPDDEPEKFLAYERYCEWDGRTEEDCSYRMEPMTPAEREAWLHDQTVNWRGIAMDRKAIRDCIAVLEQAIERYGQECVAITGGLGPAQGEALKGWFVGRGVHGIISFDSKKSPVEEHLKRTDLPDDVRRVLEIRALIGSAAVKKLYAMEHRTSADDRLRGLFIHHGTRTGRPTGEGVQSTNLVKIGPKLIYCPDCKRAHKADALACPWCLRPTFLAVWGCLDKDVRPHWSVNMVDDVLAIMATRNLDTVEHYYGDAVRCMQGCIRSLFIAKPGHDLIASDYSSLEAVIAACIAGEQWRIDTFRRKEDIYLRSASAITGIPYETYIAYFEEHGEHHPDRQKIGKVAELALGFGGWIGSWRAFDPEAVNKTDEEISPVIRAWRDASPAIVEMWGGQRRYGTWTDELYGIEGAMINAIRNPGYRYDVGCLSFYMTAPFGVYDRLKMRLPSGREITYHQPQLTPSDKRPGTLAISYMTDNSNPKYGALGWVRMSTWGSRVFENAVQAIEACIQRFSLKNQEDAGYPIVQEVYDENVAEVPEGWGSVEEFERIQMILPDYCVLTDGSPWPIRASGGWRGKRYRKS